MVKAVPALGELGLATYAWAPPKLFADPKGDLAHPIKDFYLTNSICRASPTMQRCSAELLHGEEILEAAERSEEHTSELQSLMRSSYAVFCLKKKILLLKKQYFTTNTNSKTQKN